MNETVNIHEAKTHLSRLLEKVSQGEPVVIARAGKPIARIVRVDAPSPGSRRRIGFLKGQLEVPDDFDHIGADEIVAAFEGGDASAS
ncbi:MAG: type II toxin-antitoxin system Phd/YefM family antitoxin [Spiribacter salinus]|uniref:Antitoxin n=1 Tax=Spiribacter salinus TaxID=1335746 RepID=A0A540V7F3_9GAMM|nr:MAG: type II toxin-antitoxin system Phd/YefM family antitoxin [Spiribacter salinus]